ncbi:MAG: hypothetical protein DI536_30870 [Archangium gephyra]|uniref:Quercetin 2,3-dioxygenase C-terminal cupin domain-containing protein n=1 Tax=Archangium gephyra TaxID=48 RepID=A0A2W5V7F2_9BACT|nr:MAG: hypothetical protein DI536_30870 [Archangium gephyra]
MISILRSAERHHEGHDDSGTWGSFASGTSLGALAQLEEQRLEPGAGSWSWRGNGELVTYVCNGSMAFEDSLGGVGVLRASDVQVIGGGNAAWVVRNASKSDWARGFQLTFDLPPATRVTAREQRRFGATERREHLHLITAFEANSASLRTRALARIYSGVLGAGRHVVHELLAGHSAWLQVVDGECRLNEATLVAGDGASFVQELTVSLTARRPSEVLLVEVFPRKPWVTGRRQRPRGAHRAELSHLRRELRGAAIAASM